MEPLDVAARIPSWADRWWSVSPVVGVYLGAGCLSTASIEPAGRRYRLAGSRVEALPEGVVVPSPIESNILRPEVVVERLKAALPSLKRREAAISLPDAAVRVAILELTQLPVKRLEQEALFRHHLEHLFLNPLGRCRFTFQRLASTGTGKPRVLVAAIRTEILEEYEAVVRAAGLSPSVVDLSVFHLFSLYEPRICASLQPGSPGSPERRVVFLNLFDRNFTMIVADRNGPQLIRIKAFPGRIGETDLMARVLTEIDASLQASDAVSMTDEQPIERVFVFSDCPLEGLDQRVREDYHVETTHLKFGGWPEMATNGVIRGGEGGPATNGAAGSGDEGRYQAAAIALAAVGCRARMEAAP